MTVHDDYRRLPVAEVIARHNLHGLRAVRILCPYCGRTHMHPAEPGPHEALCHRGTYTITSPERNPSK
jgi:hypothetical protein